MFKSNQCAVYIKLSVLYLKLSAVYINYISIKLKKKGKKEINQYTPFP